MANPIDVRMALAHAIASGQIGQQLPNAPIHERLPQLQAIMQALASKIANQRQPMGKATIYERFPVQHGSPIDGGYSGAGIFDAQGNLVARKGFGPHPVPPQILASGMRPALGINYVQ